MQEMHGNDSVRHRPVEEHGHDGHHPEGHHCAHATPVTSASETETKPYYCPMCPGVESENPAIVRSVGCRWNAIAAIAHLQVRRFIPVRCIPRSSGIIPAIARSAGWRWSSKRPGSGESGDSEAESLARKFWLGAILTVPILFLSVGEMVPGLGLGHLVPAPINEWIQLALATVVVFWCGGIFFVRAWRSVVNRSLNMFTLIGLGVGAAYLYSAIATVSPGVFPESFKHHGELDLYFEAAAVITVLVLLGQWLEARARGRTGKAIEGLLGLAPKTAPV